MDGEVLAKPMNELAVRNAKYAGECTELHLGARNISALVAGRSQHAGPPPKVLGVDVARLVAWTETFHHQRHQWERFTASLTHASRDTALCAPQ